MKWSDPTVYLDPGDVRNPGQVMADLNEITPEPDILSECRT
jgi:hypothetical protein